MFLDRVKLTDYRNLSGTVDFASPVSVLVGPNNAGKSNVIDALRLGLSPLGGWRDRLNLQRDDFRHDGDGNPQVGELSIELGFGGLTVAQRGRMLTMLDPEAGPDRALLRLEGSLPERGRPKSRVFGGRAQVPEVEDWAREAVTFTYLPALRDAEDELRPGRGTNRLVNLLTAFAPEEADQQEIVDIARAANKDMGDAKLIREARGSVQDRLDSILGSEYAQRADLLFAEPQFVRVIGALRALVGDFASAQEMSQNGLGYNNLLYIATLLAGLSKEPEGELHLLLVEEPEAHLHPQLQGLLMRFLEQEADATGGAGRVQVILSTHSPNFTAAARVERITMMVRQQHGARGQAIGKFGLAQDELHHLDRFLDVTKASLLFARAVLLVEGLAEQLLMPLLANAAGHSLLESHVTVVNVGGLAFGPFAHLYGPDRLPHRCAVVSDGDPKEAGVGGAPGDPQDDSAPASGTDQSVAESEADTVLSATATKLLADQNANRQVYLAEKTFEWDLVAAGNWDWALAALTELHPRVARRLAEDASLDDDRKRADAMLAAISGEKGPFAQAMAQVAGTREISVPSYLAEAITFVCRKPRPLRPRASGGQGSDVAESPTSSPETSDPDRRGDPVAAESPGDGAW